MWGRGRLEIGRYCRRPRAAGPTSTRPPARAAPRSPGRPRSGVLHPGASSAKVSATRRSGGHWSLVHVAFDGLVVRIQSWCEQDDGGDAPRDVGDLARFVRCERAAEDVVLAVA